MLKEKRRYWIKLIVGFEYINNVPPIVANLFEWSSRPINLKISDGKQQLLSADLVGTRDVTTEVQVEMHERNAGQDDDKIVVKHLEETVGVLGIILLKAGITSWFRAETNYQHMIFDRVFKV